MVLSNDGENAIVEVSDEEHVIFRRADNAVSKEQFLKDLPVGETLYQFEKQPIQ